MQRAEQVVAGFGTLIERVGLLQRVGIRHDDGIDRRPVLVEHVDAFQVLFDHAAAGDPAGAQRRVDLRDRGFVDIERRERLRRGQADGRDQQNGN